MRYNKDKDYVEMIHKARWVRLRAQVIRAHPLCQMCERDGYVTASREVHHIVPVESAPTRADKERLMYDPDNLMALCTRCHHKIHTEMERGTKAQRRQRQQRAVESAIERLFGE